MATNVYKTLERSVNKLKASKTKFKVRDLVGAWIHSRVEDMAKFDASLVGTQDDLRVRPSELLSNNKINSEGDLKLTPNITPPRKNPELGRKKP